MLPVVAEQILDILLAHRFDALVHIATFNKVLRIRSVRRSDHGLDGRLDGTGEDAIERIVVGRWDRIELVIVTARAGYRQPQERLRSDINPIIDDVADVAVEMVAQSDEAQSGERPRTLPGILPVFEPVGCELFTNELV